MAAITLSNGLARIVVRPDLGAGLTAYAISRNGTELPVFREVPHDTAHPFELSNILLVPFSGRMSAGGYSFDGTFHPVQPNMPGEKLPIHGSGFSSAWTIVRQTDDEIVMALEGSGPGPFRYAATMAYRLDGAALVMTLTLTNHAGFALPYGGGFHPWFVRDGDTRLTAGAATVWLQNEDCLPSGSALASDHPDMDFATSRRLPDRGINNGFTGWKGHARIDWPQRALSVHIEASAGLSTYVLYSPSADADFFCFEPVTHPVDAFNLPDGAQANGLSVLTPGEAMTVSTRFAPVW